MRQVKILTNNELAGILTEVSKTRYEFQYVDTYTGPPVSVTLPKRKEVYVSDHLFSYFCNILPEGANRKKLCMFKKIDEKDFFGMLMALAGADFIGAIGVANINDKI